MRQGTLTQRMNALVNTVEDEAPDLEDQASEEKALDSPGALQRKRFP